MNLSQMLFAFIPRRINNRTIIAFYELLRKTQKLAGNRWKKNLDINQRCFPNHAGTISKNNGYIEDQNNYTDMAYGKATMQYSGCEVFAVYNAIYTLLKHPLMDLPDLISCFEKDGMALSGKFGTAPKALRDFLESNGFVTSFSTKEKDFDTLSAAYPSLILTMYNDRNDIRKEIHTVHISKTDDMYIAHNVYCNGKTVGPYPSLSNLIQNINGGKAKGISLIGIRKP